MLFHTKRHIVLPLFSTKMKYSSSSVLKTRFSSLKEQEKLPLQKTCLYPSREVTTEELLELLEILENYIKSQEQPNVC